MYLKCILNAPFYSKRIHVSCHFACIWTSIPKETRKGESKIHLRYMSNTLRYMYLGRFLGVTLDTYQDTFKIHHIHVSLVPSSFIKIHTIYRDTKSRYMYLRCKIHAGYMRDRDAGYMYLQGDQDMWDTSKTLMRYMYLKCTEMAHVRRGLACILRSKKRSCQPLFSHCEYGTCTLLMGHPRHAERSPAACARPKGARSQLITPSRRPCHRVAASGRGASARLRVASVRARHDATPRVPWLRGGHTAHPRSWDSVHCQWQHGEVAPRALFSVR